MIHKTEGIVLRTFPYQDNNQIATVYTKHWGVKSFILKGYRSARSRSKHSFFQPLSIIELVFFYKENQSLHSLRESKLSHLLLEVQTQPIKLSLGLAMVEIFYHCVKEEEPNVPLYTFLHENIIYLDQSEKQLIHIFIHFLVHLTSYLGFLPLDQSENKAKVSFIPQQGILRPETEHGDQVAFLLRAFLHANRETAQNIHFDQLHKRFLIKTIFEYYQHHIQGFKYPQTLKVFSEIFE